MSFEPDPDSGTFEDGTLGIWEVAVGYPCDLVPDTGSAHSGSWSLKMTSNLDTAHSMAASTPQGSPIAVVDSGTYHLGSWARSASVDVDHFEVIVGWYDSSSAFISQVTTGQIPAPISTWVHVADSTLAPPIGAAKVLIQMHASTVFGGDFGVGQVVNWDDIDWQHTAPPDPPEPGTAGIFIGLTIGGVAAEE